MAQTKKTKAGEKDFSASSAPSRKYLIAAYIGGLALAGYAVRLAWVYMTYHVLPLQGIILFIIAACFLLNVVTAKCTYTLGEEGLTLQKRVYSKTERSMWHIKISSVFTILRTSS